MGNMQSKHQSFNSKNSVAYNATKLATTALGTVGATIVDGGKAIINGVQTVVNTAVWFAATFAEGLRNVDGHYMIGN